MARRTGRVTEGEIALPRMTSEELQSLLETVIAQEVRAISIRIDGMDRALTLQATEVLRRLDELNHEADRRSAMEMRDREQYVQEVEFKEARNENLTWRNQIEKELRAFPRTTDVQQWVAVLQARLDAQTEQVLKNTKWQEAEQVEAAVRAKEVDARAKERSAQQWRISVFVGFLSTLASALIMLAITTYLHK